MPTYTKIASNTVGAGGVSTVTFSSIPATYTDLLVKVSARATAGGAFAGLVFAPNGLSTNYTLRWLGDAGGGAVSYTEAAFGYNHLFYLPASSATASVFGNGEVYIPNYASSNYKSISSEGANENNATGIYQGMTAGLWSSTAAITSLTFSTGGNFDQYSTFTLYGISNA
jgi:hypothetical protein